MFAGLYNQSPQLTMILVNYYFLVSFNVKVILHVTKITQKTATKARTVKREWGKPRAQTHALV